MRPSLLSYSLKLSYICMCPLDKRIDYNIAIDFLFPCHLWDVHLGSLASAKVTNNDLVI
jgi:hypothetical protein